MIYFYLLYNIIYLGPSNTRVVFEITGAHGIQAAVLVFVPDLHGHRGLANQSAAGQRHLRMDRRPLPVLQERAHRLEEQCPAQPVTEQVFSQSRESTRKRIFDFQSITVDRDDACHSSH